MQRIVDLLARFRRDERGVFMVIFAVLAMVLIATSGAVVDFTYTQQARTRAQTALDAATLALQSKINTLSNDDLKAQAQDILNERLGDDTITAEVDSATKNIGEGKLNIKAHIVVPTAFVQFVGISSITSVLQSEVTRSSSDLEVAVSLDVTGSMQKTTDKKGNVTSDKIGDLVTATNELIELLVQTAQEPTYSKMAIIPWSAGVNVGSTYASNVRGTPDTNTKSITAASWLSGSATNVGGVTRGRSTTTISSTSHGLSTGDTVYIKDIEGIETSVGLLAGMSATLGVAGTGLRGWTAGIIGLLPLAELSEGKSSVVIVPSCWVPAGSGAIAIALEPPPMSLGGMKGPAATLVGAVRVFGIGWAPVKSDVALTDPVAVLSKPNPLSELHPASAEAPTSMPAIAAILSALPVTRLLISPLVRRYSMATRLGG